eukprot:gene15886-18147_t
MNSRDNRDLKQEETEVAFPQMEASGAAGTDLCHWKQLNLKPQLDSLNPRQFLNPNQLALHSFSVGSHAPCTPIAGTLPRGDMGRSVTNIAHHRPLHRLEPATPGTPMSVFGNSPGPRIICRAPAGAAVPSGGAGRHHPTADVGSGGIGLVDDADELMDLDNTFTLDPEEEHRLQQNLAETRIWGTDLNINSCRNVFKIFVEYYGIQDNTTNTTTSNTDTTNTSTSNGLSLYKRQLQYMHRTGDTLLNLNCSHVKAFP